MNFVRMLERGTSTCRCGHSESRCGRLGRIVVLSAAGKASNEALTDE